MLDAKAFLKNVSARKQGVQETEQKPQRANATRSKSSQNNGSTLPHAPEAEKAILAILLQHPETIAKAARCSTPWQFYLPTHREIFQTLVDVNDSGGRIGLIEITQILGDRGRLAHVGGAAFLTDLQTAVAVPESLDWFIEIVREKACLREMISTGSKMIRAAHGLTDTTELPGMIDDFSSMVERIKRAAGGPNGSEKFDLGDLKSFDAKHDPDCLVGNRYMVRGGNCLWAGGSGYGKSSLMMQVAVYLSTGTPIFGLRPVRPLKSLIIQAENDQGDMSEQVNGVLLGVEKLGDVLPERMELIETNIGIHRVVGKSGSQFLSLLDSLLEMDRPDLVWIDPLFAFAGCDLMNSEKTGRFLREGLFPLFVKRRTCGCVLHHIGKPPRGKDKDEQPMAAIDYQYLGFGTSEIQNSFRAINILMPCGDGQGTFKLVFSKRGERAGARTRDGEWTQKVFLKHSPASEGISWLHVDEPEDDDEGKSGRPKQFILRDLLDEMSVTDPIKTKELQKQLYQERNMSRASFFRLFEIGKREKRIVWSGEGWIRKSVTGDDASETEIPGF